MTSEVKSLHGLFLNGSTYPKEEAQSLLHSLGEKKKYGVAFSACLREGKVECFHSLVEYFTYFCEQLGFYPPYISKSWILNLARDAFLMQGVHKVTFCAFSLKKNEKGEKQTLPHLLILISEESFQLSQLFKGLTYLPESNRLWIHGKKAFIPHFNEPFKQSFPLMLFLRVMHSKDMEVYPEADLKNSENALEAQCNLFDRLKLKNSDCIQTEIVEGLQKEIENLIEDFSI